MTDRETILAAFRFTLGYAEKLAADLADEELAVQPHAGMNHAAWTLGHVALGSDFVALLLGEPTVTDKRWMATYGPGSTPVSERSKYASKEELLATMRTIEVTRVDFLNGVFFELAEAGVEDASELEKYLGSRTSVLDEYEAQLDAAGAAR